MAVTDIRSISRHRGLAGCKASLILDNAQREVTFLEVEQKVGNVSPVEVTRADLRRVANLNAVRLTR
jgi:hypothetical protein